MCRVGDSNSRRISRTAKLTVAQLIKRLPIISPKFYHRHHKILPMVPAASQFNAPHILTKYYSKIRLTSEVVSSRQEFACISCCLTHQPTDCQKRVRPPVSADSSSCYWCRVILPRHYHTNSQSRDTVN